MLGLATRMLNDIHEAEDAVNEVFLEIWQKPDRFSASRGSPQAYLFLVTRSRCLDRLRKRNGRANAEAAARDLPVQASLLPAEDVELGELRDGIREAMEHLQPEPRRSLELAFFKGLTHSEIAAETQKPIGTIKGHIRRSLLQLRQHLSSHSDDGGAA